MNLAIWKKAVSDAWRQLLVSSVILVCFSWVFVWLMSQFPLDGVGNMILAWLPRWVEPWLGVPLRDLARPTGQVSILYVHAITLLVCVGWAVGRGSDSISGEIGRGTMDLILSLPIWRVSVLVAPAVVATLGAAVLAAAVLLGTAVGLLTVDISSSVTTRQFLPGAINLFCMIFCLTGVTAFTSSWSRSRWRAISLAVAFYVVSVILEMIGSLWERGSWLKYCSISTAFHPQLLILKPEENGLLAWPYNAPLLALGLVAYLVAAVVLTYRDIPSPK